MRLSVYFDLLLALLSPRFIVETVLCDRLAKRAQNLSPCVQKGQTLTAESPEIIKIEVGCMIKLGGWAGGGCVRDREVVSSHSPGL